MTGLCKLSGYIRLGKDRTGYVRLVQVRTS
jgi:hypothetical protein